MRGRSESVRADISVFVLKTHLLDPGCRRSELRLPPLNAAFLHNSTRKPTFGSAESPDSFTSSGDLCCTPPAHALLNTGALDPHTHVGQRQGREGAALASQMLREVYARCLRQDSHHMHAGDHTLFFSFFRSFTRCKKGERFFFFCIVRSESRLVRFCSCTQPMTKARCVHKTTK